MSNPMLKIHDPTAPSKPLPGVTRRRVQTAADRLYAVLCAERQELHDMRLHIETSEPADQEQWDVPLEMIRLRIESTKSELRRLELRTNLVCRHSELPQCTLARVQVRLRDLWERIEAVEAAGHHRFLPAMWLRYERIENRHELPLLAVVRAERATQVA